jgi:hypothetical protein
MRPDFFLSPVTRLKRNHSRRPSVHVRIFSLPWAVGPHLGDAGWGSGELHCALTSRESPCRKCAGASSRRCRAPWLRVCVVGVGVFVVGEDEFREVVVNIAPGTCRCAFCAGVGGISRYTCTFVAARA